VTRKPDLSRAPAAVWALSSRKLLWGPVTQSLPPGACQWGHQWGQVLNLNPFRFKTVSDPDFVLPIFLFRKWLWFPSRLAFK
jgi:hypothetical protein